MTTIITKTLCLETATQITAAALNKPLSNALQQDVQNHVESADLICLLEQQDRSIGFALFNRYQSVLYLAGIMLHPDAQGQGLAGECIARAHLEAPECSLLAIRTQSPWMWKVGRRLCSPWYPCPGEMPSTELSERAHHMAGELGCQYPVSPGFYGKALYGKKPIHKDGETQAWWDSICSFERGDAVFCLGILK